MQRISTTDVADEQGSDYDYDYDYDYDRELVKGEVFRCFFVIIILLAILIGIVWIQPKR